MDDSKEKMKVKVLLYTPQRGTEWHLIESTVKKGMTLDQSIYTDVYDEFLTKGYYLFNYWVQDAAPDCT